MNITLWTYLLYNKYDNLIGSLGGRISHRLGKQKAQFWTVVSVLFLIGIFVVVQKFWPQKQAKSETEQISSAYQDLFLKDYDGVINAITNINSYSQADKVDAYSALGQAYFGKKDFEKALANYQNALNSAGSDKQKSYYENLIGNCLREQKKYDDAISAYRSSVKLDPSNAIAWVNLINVFKIKGDEIGANDAYNQALAANPNDASIKAVKKTL